MPRHVNRVASRDKPPPELHPALNFTLLAELTLLHDTAVAALSTTLASQHSPVVAVAKSSSSPTPSAGGWLRTIEYDRASLKRHSREPRGPLGLSVSLSASPLNGSHTNSSIFLRSAWSSTDKETIILRFGNDTLLFPLTRAPLHRADSTGRVIVSPPFGVGRP